MGTNYISDNKFNTVLQRLASENSILLYDPLQKKYNVGFETALGNCSYWENFRTAEKEFYSFPFFEKRNKHKDGKWSDSQYGKKDFPYFYEFFFSVNELDVGNNNEITPISINNEQNDYECWKILFNNVMKNIKKGIVDKIVVSREVEISCCFPLDSKDIIKKLLVNNPESFVFSYRNGNKVFLGASPEILVKKEGNNITSYAIAGTASKENSETGCILLTDVKNNYEHRIVVDRIAQILKQNANNVSIGKTEILELKNLFHLKTKLTSIDEKLDLTKWVKKLHPTPAMSGAPNDKAMSIIHKYEKHDRGLFAAPIGIVDKKGDGIFIVGIRSALITDNKIYAYAGCGLVEQSDCMKEFKEIENKLRTITEALQ